MCGSATITPSSISSQTYGVGNTALEISFLSFTSTMSNLLCGNFVYTLSASPAISPACVFISG